MALNNDAPDLDGTFRHVDRRFGTFIFNADVTACGAYVHNSGAIDIDEDDLTTYTFEFVTLQGGGTTCDPGVLEDPNALPACETNFFQVTTDNDACATCG